MSNEEQVRLLIVDDEPDVTESLCYMLRKQPYEIQTANHAYEALATARRFVVDIMITDIRMPDMDGLELLREIRKINQDIMVIAISAHSNLDVAVEFMKEGGVDFLQKPVSNETLRLAIRSAIEKWRLRRDLRLANIELQKAKEVAESAVRVRSDFLANMSHEIRTPLNAVVGLTHLLADSRLTDEQMDYVRTIQMSGEVLLDIINNILSMSKIESGRLELEAISFDLRSCAESAMNMIAPKAVEKGLELIYDVDPDVPFTVIGDLGRVRQILVNLLNNAVKFTEQGEIILSIRAGIRTGNQCAIYFTVMDTGIGVDCKKMDRIFDPFKQADSSTTRKYGGTGLGLSICKELCSMMGGELSVESQVDVGSKFHFHIEVRLPAEDTVPPPFRVSVEGRTVYLSIGNKSLYRVISRVLEKWGMRVESCCTADELDRLSADPAITTGCVCVVDNTMVERMPRWIEQLRALCSRVRMPLVYLTNIGTEKIGEHVDAWLVKPVRLWKLRETLVRLLFGDHVIAGLETSREQNTGILDVPLSILLAEDNLVNQKVALKMLAKVGLTADVVANGQDAVSRMRERNYDMILMDIQMPGKDGLEATVDIRNMDKPTYIAGMTAHVLPEDRNRCIEAGMDDYIPKPVKPGLLYETIRKAQKFAQQRRLEAAGSPSPVV